MSTIASPRPSITSLTSPTPTTSTPPTPSLSRTASPSRPTNPPQRRNRTALRDYYNLKSAAPVDASNGAQHEEEEIKESELDAEGFDAEAYVKSVLANQGLEGVLKVEGALINEIKGLDGERKALVYDNYSKLITATDTIRRMRMNMDPLTPTTSTLSPAVAHIVETAKALAGALQDSDGNAKEKPRVENNEAATLKEAQQDTVRWVLATPMRLRSLLDDGKREEADNDWVEIKGLLEGWHGVAGVQDLRNQCSMIMAGKTSDSNT